jgi:uncharacterized repeat protein (TIGR02543 family)
MIDVLNIEVKSGTATNASTPRVTAAFSGATRTLIPAPEPIQRGKPLSVQFGLYGTLNGFFSGEISLGLYSAGNLVELIEKTHLTLNSNFSTFFTFSSPQITASCGTYTLTLYQKNSADVTSKVLNGNFSNDVTVTVTGNTYTVTFDTQGGSSMAPQAISSCVTSLPTPPSRTGYTFEGWFRDADCSNAWTSDDIFTRDITLYAKWVSLVPYTITYELDGGTNNPANPANYTVESPTITLQNPTKTGYNFVEWSEGNTIPTGSTGNKTFTAVWTPTIYTITYVLNDGVNHSGNPTNYTIESPTITLQNPTKTGYNFVEWSEGNTISTGSIGNKTFTAIWTPTIYTITYVLNDGVNHSGNPANYTIESPTITLQNPTREGYNFAKWTEGNTIATGSIGNKTFTAEWTACVLTTVGISPPTVSICTGGNITLTANGADTYTWSPATGLNTTTGAGVTASPTVTTTYTVTGTTGSCSGQATVEVTVNPLPTAGITNNTGTIILTCTNPTISLTATGGTSYSWSNSLGNNANAIVTEAGTYTITVTTANGCTATENIEITKNKIQPTLNITKSPDVSQLTCATPDITLTATGGVSYSWNTGETSASITVSNARTYEVTVTGTNGCTNTDFIEITKSTDVPTVSITPQTAVLTCMTTSIKLTATVDGGIAPFTYSWGAADTTITTPGTYTVKVTDVNGCTETARALIDKDDAPPTLNIIKSLDITELTCTTPDIMLTANTTGVSYLWDTGETSASITASNAGTYEVTVTGANGCTRTDFVEITANKIQPTPNITKSPDVTQLTCATPDITLTATGGVSYSWNTGETSASITVSNAGTYEVTVIGTNGCTNTDFVEITKSTDVPTVSITPQTAVLTCVTTSIKLTATVDGGIAPFTYSWGAADTTITTPGTYTVKVTDVNDCSANQNITISVAQSLPAITVNDAEICQGNNTTLTASGADTYTWSPATGLNTTTGASVMASPTVTTTYTVTGTTTANGCSNTKQVTVTVKPLPTAIISGSTSACSGSNTTLEIALTGTQPWTIVYNNGSSDITVSGITASPYELTVSPTVTTTYSLVSITDLNCSNTASGSATITVKDPEITLLVNPIDYGCVLEAPTFDTDTLFSVTDIFAADPKANVTDKGIVGDGCNYSRTFTAGYKASCGVEADSVSITYHWRLNVKPVITVVANGSRNYDCLTSEPTDIPTFNVSNNCDPNAIVTNIVMEAASSFDGGCIYIKRWTANYQSACGQSADPVTVTYTWTLASKPVITTTAVNSDLGMNPTVVPPTFTGMDNCEGNITLWIAVTTSGPIKNGCNFTQTWIANYTNGCGRAADPVSITYTWFVEDDANKPVITLPNPTLAFCGENLEIELNAFVSPDESIIEWFDSNNTTVGTGKTITVNPPSIGGNNHRSEHNYKVVATLCGREESLMTVYIDKPPTGMITATSAQIREGESVTINAGSYNADAVTWTSQAFTGEKHGASITEYPQETTTYYVEIRRGTCIVTDAITIEVTERTIIPDVLASVLQLYPNPIKQGKSLNIKLSKGLTDGVLSIYDATGSLKKRQTLPAVTGHSIDTSDLSPGIWLFHIVGKDGYQQATKVIVE